MNKLFYFLLFCSVTGAGVLWWLMNSMEPDAVVQHEVSVEHKESVLKVEESQEGEVLESPQRVEPVFVVDQETQELAASQTATSNATAGTSSLFQSDAKASQLNITSEPSGVTVYLNSKKIGVTPIERTLTTEVQKFRFEKEGFVPVEREAPAEKQPEGAYLSWRINMVAQQSPADQKPKVGSTETHFLKGVSGPVFVQLRAVSEDQESRAEISQTVDQIRATIKDNKVYACEVSLGDKGKWNRILVGPFNSRQEAQRSLGFLKTSLNINDIFVTGAQSCL